MLKANPVENPYIGITLIEMLTLYKCHIENCNSSCKLGSESYRDTVIFAA